MWYEDLKAAQDRLARLQREQGMVTGAAIIVALALVAALRWVL